MNRYLTFFKPYGVLSQFSPEPGTTHRTLKDFVNIPGVYAAGRLDHDSEGLMLLTDDGALQHRLSDPKFEHPRTYWVQLERIPDEAALEKLRKGIRVQDYITKQATAFMLAEPPKLPPREPEIRYRKNVPTAWISITLTEGRNRQVRRMTAAVGHATLRLVRAAIGGVTLEGLQPGKWREWKRNELLSKLNSY